MKKLENINCELGENIKYLLKEQERLLKLLPKVLMIPKKYFNAHTHNSRTQAI